MFLCVCLCLCLCVRVCVCAWHPESHQISQGVRCNGTPMCVGMCMNMCIGMCIDKNCDIAFMCADICVDMGAGMPVGMPQCVHALLCAGILRGRQWSIFVFNYSNACLL